VEPERVINFARMVPAGLTSTTVQDPQRNRGIATPRFVGVILQYPVSRLDPAAEIVTRGVKVKSGFTSDLMSLTANSD
jgi:hypothetical protein